MPRVALVDAASVPRLVTRPLSAEYAAATALLQSAVRDQKAIALTIEADEHDHRFRKLYSRAAKALQIKISFRCGLKRAYTSKTGRVSEEASVLYIRVVDAPRLPDAPYLPARRPIVEARPILPAPRLATGQLLAGRPTIDTSPRPPELEPITGALVSR